jgi:pimeloyl-ACP methyl ester carboxylesterase
VRICGQDIDRLVTAGQDALRQGLEVWLSPELWDSSPDETLDYIADAAGRSEGLRQQWPGRVVFSVGSDSTVTLGSGPGSPTCYGAFSPTTVLLGGDRSPAHLGERLDALARRMPRAESVVLHGQGHGAHQRAPDQVARVIANLADKVLR